MCGRRSLDLPNDLHEIFSAILYLNSTGIPCRYLLCDLPYRTRYGYVAASSEKGSSPS